MLSIIFLQLFVTILALASGFIFYEILGNDIKNNDTQFTKRPLINYFLSGLIAITFVTQFLQLFLPINYFLLIILISVIIILLVLFRKNIPTFLAMIKEGYSKINPLSMTGIIFAGIMIAVLASGPIIQDDSESYHMQIIQWSKLHKAVAGIANLHLRFGFQSSWFSLTAIFLPEIGKVNFFALLNSLVCFWFTAYCFSVINLTTKGKVHSSLSISVLIILAISLLSWPLLRGSSTNTNYDLISTIVILVLAIQLAQSESNINSFPNILEWMVWPFYLLTIRTINFPFLILAFFSWLYLWRQKKIRYLATLSVFCFLLVAGQIIRTYIASGYLFFPLKTFEFLKPDWAVPHKIIDDFVTFTRYYNRVPEEYQAISTTMDLGPINWVIPWFRYLSIIDKIITVLSFLGIIKAAKWIHTTNKFNSSNPIPFLFWACVIHLISWMIISPAPRFAYNSLIIFSCVALTPVSIIKKTNQIRINWIIISASFFYIAGIILYTINKIRVNEEYRHYVVPVSIPQPPDNTIQISGMQFHIPGKIGTNWNPRCYCLPLPCLYEPIPGLMPRGTTLECGFRIKQN